MKLLKLLSVVGARPNFMKIAPLIRAFRKYPQVNHFLVHTGQHYDSNMSDVFFRELDIPCPEINLEVKSGSHAIQTARIMEGLEPILLHEKPDLVIVVGDVNSTMAAAIVAKKLCIPVAHVEAGLRSFDSRMPEEINRKLTDAISDFLFTPSPDADENLLKEGVNKKNIFQVGNCMIDTLFFELKKLEKKKQPIDFSEPLSLEGRGHGEGDPHRYAVLTLHRPSNVDNPKVFKNLLETFGKISKKIPIQFPIHPRTMERMKHFGLSTAKDITLLDPLSYVDFLKLYKNAAFVITDSGGIQEETTVLQIPCITLRENTERPITVTHGTNHLVGINQKKILKTVDTILKNKTRKTTKICHWDGKTAERIAKILVEKLGGSKRGERE